MTAFQFFYKHAGYSYDPAKETKRQGRTRCAHLLANAEAKAQTMCFVFEWDIDPEIDSSDFSDEKPAWALWTCVCRNASGAVEQSLCGIDFGRDGEPWNQPYKRVVEAELALEAIGELTSVRV